MLHRIPKAERALLDVAVQDAADAVDAPPDGLWAAIDAEISGVDAGDTGAPVVDLDARRPRRALRIALGAAAAVLLVVATVATLASVRRRATELPPDAHALIEQLAEGIEGRIP